MVAIVLTMAVERVVATAAMAVEKAEERVVVGCGNGGGDGGIGEAKEAMSAVDGKEAVEKAVERVVAEMAVEISVWRAVAIAVVKAMERVVAIVLTMAVERVVATAAMAVEKAEERVVVGCGNGGGDGGIGEAKEAMAPSCWRLR